MQCKTKLYTVCRKLKNLACLFPCILFFLKSHQKINQGGLVRHNDTFCLFSPIFSSVSCRRLELQRAYSNGNLRCHYNVVKSRQQMFLSWPQKSTTQYFHPYFASVSHLQLCKHIVQYLSSDDEIARRLRPHSESFRRLKTVNLLLKRN